MKTWQIKHVYDIDPHPVIERHYVEHKVMAMRYWDTYMMASNSEEKIHYIEQYYAFSNIVDGLRLAMGALGIDPDSEELDKRINEKFAKLQFKPITYQENHSVLMGGRQ